MTQLVPHERSLRVLIVIPGGISYFYDVIGRRFASAFRNLGCDVNVCRLKDYQVAEYDIVLYANLSEIALIHVWDYPDAAKVRILANQGEPDLSAALRQLELVQQNTRYSGLLLLECVRTHWFTRSYQIAQAIGVNALYDVGFHSQSVPASAHEKIAYRFLFNTLTEAERQRVVRTQSLERERPIPWAFVGHMNARRLEFVYTLLKRVNSRGVFYLPNLEPVTPDGPHFNAEQLRRLLEKTRYYIWTSHHDYFYIESERFRDAFLAGCVPIKVWWQVAHSTQLQGLFSYLILGQDDFEKYLLDSDYVELRRRFIEDFLALPSLEESVASIISDYASS